MLYVSVQIKVVLNNVERTTDQISKLRETYKQVHPLFDSNFKVNEEEHTKRSKQVSDLIGLVDKDAVLNEPVLGGILASHKSLTDLDSFVFDMLPNIEKMKKTDARIGLKQTEQSEITRFYDVNYLRIRMQMWN